VSHVSMPRSGARAGRPSDDPVVAAAITEQRAEDADPVAPAETPAPSWPRADAPLTVEQVTDEDYYTVICGYGNVSEKNVTFIDGFTFRGGIARNVPGATVKAWLKLPMFRTRSGKPAMKVLPMDATDADIVRAAGAPTISMARLAAAVLSADPNALTREFRPGELALLAEQFRAAAIRAVERPAS
jgi:hypothetical protein